MTSTDTGRSELTGRIVRRGDTNFEAARSNCNLLFSHDPVAVVFAQEAKDVVNALAWARQNDVAVRVRSGGHCLEGWSNVDDGLVIDVSELKSARVDTESNTATVGAGLNQLEAVTALGSAGVVAPTGTEGSVGLFGATPIAALVWAVAVAANVSFGIVTSLTYRVHPLSQCVYIPASLTGLGDLP